MKKILITGCAGFIGYNLTLYLLKKKYKSKCLKFHPDKHGNKEKFVELKEAYDFILSQPKQTSFLEEFDEKMLRQYLYTLYKTDLSIFKNPFFVRHFIQPVQEHLNQYKTYTLCPSLENLFKKDIYYLQEEQLYIPLWHHEIVFHGKIKVILTPKLPSHIEIDENNNIFIRGETQNNSVQLGTISFLMTESEKKEKRLLGKGIPRVQTYIYDTHELSDIILLPS
jgi:DnaJ family protein A protein 2